MGGYSQHWTHWSDLLFMRNAQMFCIRTDHASFATFRFLGSGPVRNQAPPQSVQGALFRFWVKPDREHVLRFQALEATTFQ
jgi:hypothetical protein